MTKEIYKRQAGLLAIFFIILVAFILRIYKINDTMMFIGDQGWFYLSARDALLTGKIPLVGITASYTWLHQGPFWTYILMLIFKIFNFSPIAPAYFTALMGVLTVWLIYKITSEFFSKNVGIIASSLYGTSPLIILYDRMPYHTSLIPIFTALFVYSLYKWIKRQDNFFPLSMFLLGILYNFELATMALWIILLIIFLYGLVKNNKWFTQTIKYKIILYSVFAFILPLIPMIIYDIKSHTGFYQITAFARLIKIFAISNHSLSSQTLSKITSFLYIQNKDLIFMPSAYIAFLITIICFAFFTRTIFIKIKNNALNSSWLLLCLWIFIPLFGIYLNGAASMAYIPILFPCAVILIALTFNRFININKLKYLGITSLLLVLAINSYSLISYLENNSAFKDREISVSKVIQLSGDSRYNLVGKGEGSQFESFTMNYEYLLWWKGHPSSKTNVKTKIIVSESPKGIIIEKR